MLSGGVKYIIVCDEWLDIRNFIAWVTQWEKDNCKSTKGLTIDRLDNRSNFEPSNCTWIPLTENSIKGRVIYTRKVIDKITKYSAVKGITANDAASSLGYNPRGYRKGRLKYYGSICRIHIPWSKIVKQVEDLADKEGISITAACSELDVKYDTYYYSKRKLNEG